MAVSFSQSVKNEILQGIKGAPACCELAFLAGFVRTAGNVSLNRSGLGFSVVAENPDILKKVSAIITKLYGVETEMLEERSVRHSRVRYVLKVANGEQILMDCGIITFDGAGLRQINNSFDSYLVQEECCAKTFVKAVFLGSGSVTLPEEMNKDGYHLEFALAAEGFEASFAALLKSLDFTPKKVLRKGETVLYFKGGDLISDILAFLGAVKNVFRLQNTIAERSLRNRANRQTNCISANIDKTVEAAEKQLKAIKLIEEKDGLLSLPANLRQAALLRQENPTDSLDELAALSGMSKSGLNHRFKRIAEIAKNFEN